MGGNRPRELVLDGIAGLVLRDILVVAVAEAIVAVFGSIAGGLVAGVGVQHVAGGTSAAAIVSGPVVHAQLPERRIVQAGLKHIEVNRSDAPVGSGTANAECRIIDFSHTQGIANPSDFKLGMGIQL